MQEPFEMIVGKMSEEDRELFRDGCGIGTHVFPSAIEQVEPLKEAEEPFFDPRGFISPYFSIQRIYKVQGKISPLIFNKVVFAAFESEKELRSNYCRLSDKWVKVVYKERRDRPEIIYRNLASQGMSQEEQDASLAKFAEAERRRPFNLTRDPLVRFLVVKTSPGELAIVVTGLYLVLCHLEVARIIAESQELEYKPESLPKVPARKGPREISESVMNYWQKVLEHLPRKPVLPGFLASPEHFSQSSYRAVIPQETVQLLKSTGGELQKMMGLLYMAWGLFLQFESKARDTYFLLLSGIEEQEGASLGMIPVRLKCPAKETVESAAARLSKQLALSSPFSCFESKGLERLLGERRYLFDHFLNFHAFTGRGVDYGDRQGASVGEQVYEQAWDAQGMPLGIYFQYIEGNISLSVLYNRYSIGEAGVGELCSRYLLTLHTMLLNMDRHVEDFEESLRRRAEFRVLEKEARFTEKKAAAYLEELPFFHGCSEQQMTQLSRAAKVLTFFENDQIIMKHELGRLYFLLEGRVARLMDPGSGWYSTLDVAKEGRVLNETVLLRSCKSSIIGEVLSEQVRVLSLPLPQVVDLLGGSEVFRQNFFRHILNEMEKYQRRWVSN